MPSTMQSKLQGLVCDQIPLMGVCHAFAHSNGQVIRLGTLPGGDSSYALGINDAGQVTGYSGTFNYEVHAFLYSNGQMTDLGTLPGYTFSSGSAINDAGQVTGYSTPF